MELLSNKEKVKEIFDNIRNFLICGAVFFVGVYIFNIKPVSMSAKVQLTIYWGSLFIVAGILYSINLYQALNIATREFKNSKAIIPRILILMFSCFYIIATAPVFLSPGIKILN